MRDDFNAVLKDELRYLAIKTRDRLGITQNEMAEELTMSGTSYSVIEAGVYMCGTLTAILLLNMQDDPSEFLQHMKRKFEELEKSYEQEEPEE